MLEIFRRILWLAPKFFAVALALFALYSQMGSGSRSRPLFLNWSPESASSAAERALEGLRLNRPDAAAEIQRLGAWFVLYAIPRQGTLDPKTRVRLVEAMHPIRERMGLTRKRGDSTIGQGGGEGLVFWTRFVEERSLDFTPQARSRAIKRLLSSRTQLKGDDLRVLDTYALPALVDGLGRVGNAEDVRRVEKLADAIRRLTSPEFSLAPESTTAEAKEMASRIRGYWDHAGAAYTNPSPIHRAYQSLVQTEFFVWSSRTARWLVDLDSSPLRARVKLDWSRNGALYLSGVIGAIVFGPLLALAFGLRTLGQRDRRRSRWRRLILVAVLGGSLGLVTTVQLPTALELALSLAIASLTSAFVLDRELAEHFDVRMIRVLSQRSARQRTIALIGNLAPAIPTLLPIILFETLILPLCFSSQGRAFGFRHALAAAFRHGDVEYLMLVSLCLGIATSLLQITADAFLTAARRTLGEL